MKVKLEDREYELKANGRFLLKYQELFDRNAVLDIYKGASEKDIVACQRLVYCAIDEKLPFDEWLDTFETPFFLLPVMEDVLAFLVRSINPTVKSNSTDEKKTKETEN